MQALTSIVSLPRADECHCALLSGPVHVRSFRVVQPHVPGNEDAVGGKLPLYHARARG